MCEIWAKVHPDPAAVAPFCIPGPSPPLTVFDGHRDVGQVCAPVTDILLDFLVTNPSCQKMST